MTTHARLLAILGLLLLGLGIGIAAVQEDGFTRLAKIVSLAGMSLLFVSALVAFGAIVAALRTRQGRYGMNVIVGSIFALGIVILANVLASRRFERVDFTSTGHFSLSPQTHRVLERLREEDRRATLYSFVPPDEPGFRAVMDLVREYDFASDRVNVRSVDAAKDPGTVERLAVDETTWLAVEVGKRVERIAVGDAFREQPITNAFVRAIQDERKSVLFLTGHGERSLSDASPAGYGELRELLARENYRVDVFSFLEADSIPGDCAVFVVAGPRTPLFPEEVDRIRHHLERGRGVFLAIDPVYEDGRPLDLGVAPLLEPYGIAAGEGMIYDSAQFSRQRGGGDYRPFANTYGDHPVTAGFSRSMITVFQEARAVRAGQGRGRAVSLIRTSSRTWEEMDPHVADEKPSADAGRDVSGPLSIAVAVSEPAQNPEIIVSADPSRRLRPKETRLVVFGDSDFVSNALVRSIRANRDVFLNSMGWLAEEEDLVAVRARQPDDRRLEASAAERNFMRIASIVLFPAGVLGAGLFAWARRRRRDI